MNEESLLKFVTVWQTAESVVEVASQMDMTKQQCCALAVYLRKKGVPLEKKYNKGNTSLLTTLIKLAKENQKKRPRKKSTYPTLKKEKVNQLNLIIEEIRGFA